MDGSDEVAVAVPSLSSDNHRGGDDGQRGRGQQSSKQQGQTQRIIHPCTNNNSDDCDYRASRRHEGSSNSSQEAPTDNRVYFHDRKRKRGDPNDRDERDASSSRRDGSSSSRDGSSSSQEAPVNGKRRWDDCDGHNDLDASSSLRVGSSSSKRQRVPKRRKKKRHVVIDNAPVQPTGTATDCLAKTNQDEENQALEEEGLGIGQDEASGRTAPVETTETNLDDKENMTMEEEGAAIGRDEASGRAAPVQPAETNLDRHDDASGFDDVQFGKTSPSGRGPLNDRTNNQSLQCVPKKKTNATNGEEDAPHPAVPPTASANDDSHEEEAEEASVNDEDASQVTSSGVACLNASQVASSGIDPKNTKTQPAAHAAAHLQTTRQSPKKKTSSQSRRTARSSAIKQNAGTQRKHLPVQETGSRSKKASGGGCCSSLDGTCCSRPQNHYTNVFGKGVLSNSTKATSATSTSDTTSATTTSTTTPAADPPSIAFPSIQSSSNTETAASEERCSDNNEKRLFGGVKPELNQQAVDHLQKLTTFILCTGTSSLDIGHQGFVQFFKLIQENLYGLADLLETPRVRVQELDVPTALARHVFFMNHQPVGSEFCANECIELVKEKLLEHFLEDIPIGKEDEISQFGAVVDCVPGFLLEKTTAHDDTKDLMSALGQENWENFVAAPLTAYSRMMQCNRKEAGDEHAEDSTPAMVMGGDSSPQMKFVSSWCLEPKEKGCDFTFEHQGHLHIRCSFHPQALCECCRHRHSLLKPWLVAMWDIGLTSMLQKGMPSLRDRCSFDLKWKECSTFFWGLVRRREIMGDHSDPAKAQAAWCRFLDKQQLNFNFSLELLKLSCPLEGMRKFVDDQGVDKLYGFKPVTASSHQPKSLSGSLPAGLGGLPLEDLRGRPELIGLVFDLPASNLSTETSLADDLTPPPAPSSDPECCEEGCRLWKSGNKGCCPCHCKNHYDCGTCQFVGDDGEPCHLPAVGIHGCCGPHHCGTCQFVGDDGEPCHLPAIGTHGCCGPHHFGTCQFVGDDGEPCHRPAVGSHGCCGPHNFGTCQSVGDDGRPCHLPAVGTHGCCKPHCYGPCQSVGDDGRPCHRPAVGTHGCCGPHNHGTCQAVGDDGRPCHRLAIGTHGCCGPHHFGTCQSVGDDGRPCHRPAVGSHGCCGPHNFGTCQFVGDDGEPCHLPAIGTHGRCKPHHHGPCQSVGDDGRPCHRLAVGPHGRCGPHHFGPCKGELEGDQACDGEAIGPDGLCSRCHFGFTDPVKRRSKTKCTGKNGQGCPWNRKTQKLCLWCKNGPCQGLNNEKCPHNAPATSMKHELCTKCRCGNIKCKGTDGVGCPKENVAEVKSTGLCGACDRGWCKGINGNQCPRNSTVYAKKAGLCKGCNKHKKEEQASSK